MSDKQCLVITDVHPATGCKGGVEYLFNSQLYPALKEAGYKVSLWLVSPNEYKPHGRKEAYNTEWDAVIVLKESSLFMNLALNCTAKVKVAFFNTDIKLAGWNGRENEEELTSLLSVFDKVYCPTKASKQSLLDYLECELPALTNVDVFTPSIPKEFLNSDDKYINDAYCAKNTNKFNLLMVGNYRREKFIPQTIRALRPLLATGKYHLTIIGGHSESDKLTKEIQAYAAAFPEHITLTGELSQQKVAEYMRTSQILLNASPYESFSLVIRQALYSGLPVLTVYTPGIVENIYDYTVMPSSLVVPNLDFFVPMLTTLFDLQGYSLDKIRCELGILARLGHPFKVEKKSKQDCDNFIKLLDRADKFC